MRRVQGFIGSQMAQLRQVHSWSQVGKHEVQVEEGAMIAFSAWQVLVPILRIIFVVIFVPLLLPVYARDVAFDGHGLLGGL